MDGGGKFMTIAQTIQKHFQGWTTAATKLHDTRTLQPYFGHRNIQHTVRYTELALDRFKDFWR
jgi:hypothetical protein